MADTPPPYRRPPNLGWVPQVEELPRRPTFNAALYSTSTVDVPPPLQPPALPAVLVNAVVLSLGKVPEGDLIQLVDPAWVALLKLLARDPDARFQIPDRTLEEVVAASYVGAGFDEVVLTPRSGDRGRDVIATKSGFFSVRIVDQVKAFRAGHLVKADDVRALGWVLQADNNASKGLVTTTSDFAPGIADEFKLYMPHRLELVNGSRLLDRLAHFAMK